MRGSFAISFVFHMAIIVMAALGLPNWFQPDEFVIAPMVVEIVEIDEITKAPAPPKPTPVPKIAKAVEAAPKEEEPERKETPAPPPPPPKPEPKPKPKPEPPKKKKVAAMPPPKPEPKPAPPPEPKPIEKTPEPPKPKPEPKPVVKEPDPEPVKKEEPKPEEPKLFAAAPTPRVKPAREKTKPKPKPKKKFNASRIAALLDKREPKKSSDGAKESKSTARTRNSAAAVNAPNMTMSELDAIRHQIEQNWSIPGGVRDADDLYIMVRIFLNQDGTLARPPELVDKPFNAGDYYRAAADSALRAVRLSVPLKGLPLSKYDHWREITIRFDPKEMING